MRWWNAPFCLLLCLAPAARLAAQTSDGITLTLSPGPGPLEVSLEWTGGQPDFEIFRSADPALIFDSGSRLGETSSRLWVDLPDPDGVAYYAVAPKDPPDATLVPGAPDRVLLEGTVVAPDGPFEGEVLIEGSLVTCVAPSCSGQPGAAGATVVTTNGIILPGLIDAHNHGLFNIFDESDWSPQRLYTNHNQWTAEMRYQQMVDAKQYLGGEGASPVDVRCEMDKYAEIKALAAGTTSFLLAPGTSRACFASLARTIDTPQNDLQADRIQTSIAVPTNTSAQSVCNNFASGTTNAYVVHIAEGTDQTALNEFNTLAGRAGGCLLSPLTTIVHGTALGATEFTTMTAHGMCLVWSPKSNLFLYGATTRVDLAIAAGVSTIALAPDWALGGGVNLLDELRFADAVDAAQFGDILTPERLFRMVTIDAARALGVEALVGSLEPGKRADITVIGGDRSDPYAALLAATPREVRLVMVDGRALFGDAALIAAGPATPGCETIPLCGRDKFLCAAEASTADKLDQTYGEILQVLESALANYDAGVLAGTAPGFSPIAPLASCP